MSGGCPGQYGAPCGQPVTHVYHGFVVRVPLCAGCAAAVAAWLARGGDGGRPDRVRVEAV